MTPEGKKRALQAIRRAYGQMTRECSTHRCFSSRKREALAHELWECGLEDHRTIICRLCYLLSERLLDPARVGTDDLDLLDAAQDFAEYERPDGWRIDWKNGELIFD